MESHQESYELLIAICCLQMKLAAAEQATSCAKAAAAEASSRASRAQERLAVMEAQLEDAQSAAKEAAVVTKQLKEDLKHVEQAAKRKLENEKAAKRALKEELAGVRQELSQLQGMLGPGVAVPDAGGITGGFGPGGAMNAPWQQKGGGAWRHDDGAGGAVPGPPALAAPGFKWLLVREDEEPLPTAAAPSAASSALDAHQQTLEGPQTTGRQTTLLDDEADSQLGSPHSVRSAAASSNAGGGYTRWRQQPSSASGSIFDAAEQQQQQQQQQHQLRQWTGAGPTSEAAVQRLRAALRQKVGECSALEARLRELEATRDQLATELVAATHRAEKVSRHSHTASDVLSDTLASFANLEQLSLLSADEVGRSVVLLSFGSSAVLLGIGRSAVLLTVGWSAVLLAVVQHHTVGLLQPLAQQAAPCKSRLFCFRLPKIVLLLCICGACHVQANAMT